MAKISLVKVFIIDDWLLEESSATTFQVAVFIDISVHYFGVHKRSSF